MDPPALALRLASWFATARRELPWRHERTAYRVWLSEIMLQQTQVSVVIPYFERFLARYPTVEALARAPLDDVLAQWSGLGYYARGRNLHRAAIVVADALGGTFPSSAEGLRALPGVGPYTANAIASIAFGARVPVVDGNVARVIARVLDEDAPVDGPAGRARIDAAARALVDATADPGAHNEALMELGALVCTPKAPDCARCPLSSSCQARRAGTVALRPVKRPRRVRTALSVATAVLHDDARVLLVRRPARGLFGALFAPPSVVVDEGPPGRALRAHLATLGVAAPRLPRPVRVERTLTHRDVTFAVYALPGLVPDDDGDGRRAVPFSALASLGMSSAARAVLAAVIPGVGRFFGDVRRHQ